MARSYYDQLDEYRKTWDPRDREQVLPTERFWVGHQRWLEGCGYMLRPRYNPDWVPSWRGTKKWSFSCEDGQGNPPTRSHLMDATRISDGTFVALKMVFRSEHPYEAEISKFLCSGALASNSQNHCVPMFEALEVPDNEDMLLLIMPFLRPCTDPRFETIGEAVEFFRQIFEGLQFMHNHHVAHRDCFRRNIMMDAKLLYPDGYHPTAINRNRNFRGQAKHYTRTERPPKYFLIDFGLSRRYDPKDGPPLELPIRGGDKSVPEFQGEGYWEASDPFATDIYYIGNMMKEIFLETCLGFEFMLPLVTEMTQGDPSKRPTIHEVVPLFDRIYHSLSTSKLRSRVIQRKELGPLRWWRNSGHFFRRVRFTLQRIPPVPRTIPLRQTQITPQRLSPSAHSRKIDVPGMEHRFEDSRKPSLPSQ